MITSPPVWWLGSSFQLWSAGAAALFSFFIVHYLVSFVNIIRRFLLYFQWFPGFAGLRVFRPDRVPGAGGFSGGSVGRVTPEMPDERKKELYSKISQKIKKALKRAPCNTIIQIVSLLYFAISSSHTLRSSSVDKFACLNFSSHSFSADENPQEI